jgi:DNA-binding MarR family transcriptional regulator
LRGLAEVNALTKHEIVASLAEAGQADAAEIAEALGVPYATSAMALLRLVRQGLAARRLDPDRGMYTYWLTDHGRARLAFFEEEQPPRHPGRAALVSRSRPSPWERDATMKRKKLHTGTYHCPACFIEFDLVAEESLRCDQCQGPLAKGPLDDIWEDGGEDESDDVEDE